MVKVAGGPRLRELRVAHLLFRLDAEEMGVPHYTNNAKPRLTGIPRKRL